MVRRSLSSPMAYMLQVDAATGDWIRGLRGCKVEITSEFANFFIEDQIISDSAESVVSNTDTSGLGSHADNNTDKNTNNNADNTIVIPSPLITWTPKRHVQHTCSFCYRVLNEPYTLIFNTILSTPVVLMCAACSSLKQ